MNTENKQCFIITPIGSESSDIRRAIDGVINSVIIPVLEKLKFSKVIAAHHITVPGSINNQVIDRVVNDDLVIANLSGLNANVMYELAIRHTTKKPIIHICEEGTTLPFDIKDQRTIFYKNDMKGVKELEKDLENMVREVMKKDQWDDNPVYNAVKEKIFQQMIIEKPEKQFEMYLLEKVESLQSKIDELVWPSIENSDIIKRKSINKGYVVRTKIKKGDGINTSDIIRDILRCSVGFREAKIIRTSEIENSIEYTIVLRPAYISKSIKDVINSLNEDTHSNLVFYTNLINNENC